MIGTFCSGILWYSFLITSYFLFSAPFFCVKRQNKSFNFIKIHSQFFKKYRIHKVYGELKLGITVLEYAIIKYKPKVNRMNSCIRVKKSYNCQHTSILFFIFNELKDKSDIFYITDNIALLTSQLYFLFLFSCFSRQRLFHDIFIHLFICCGFLFNDGFYCVHFYFHSETSKQQSYHLYHLFHSP